MRYPALCRCIDGHSFMPVISFWTSGSLLIAVLLFFRLFTSHMKVWDMSNSKQDTGIKLRRSYTALDGLKKANSTQNQKGFRTI